jgi:anti-sigma-K factor RskA
MTGDLFLELAPLAALGALDGEDRERFEAHEATCEACRREVAEFRKVVDRLPLATEPVPPRLPLRFEARQAAPSPGLRPLLWAMAAALLLSLGLLTSSRIESRSAARELAEETSLAASAQDEARRVSAELASLGERFQRDAAFAALARSPGSRMVHLAGGKEAPKAGACIVWNPTRQEAVLMATALAPAPKDKAYEVWVIAGKSPTPAGMFQTDEGWKALVTLPPMPQLAEAQSFAVTLEPSAGTEAPTGPVVLAGTAGP